MEADVFFALLLISTFALLGIVRAFALSGAGDGSLRRFRHRAGSSPSAQIGTRARRAYVRTQV